ncbi:hypothetical protein ACFDTO_36630 [Microbacteriaceae bacterium 4G12]
MFKMLRASFFSSSVNFAFLLFASSNLKILRNIELTNITIAKTPLSISHEQAVRPLPQDSERSVEDRWVLTARNN